LYLTVGAGEWALVYFKPLDNFIEHFECNAFATAPHDPHRKFTIEKCKNEYLL
jgi:hypothetical protein